MGRIHDDDDDDDVHTYPPIPPPEDITKDTKLMWISPILAFDNHKEAKQYYKGIIEKTFKKGPFDCSEDYSDECQKEVLTAYLTVLACPKDSRNLMNIGLIEDAAAAAAGLCLFIYLSCDTVRTEEYNRRLLNEVAGDHSYPFGRDEYEQISQEKPMWSFQNRRDYLVDVLSKHTTIPLETLKGLEGVKMPENPSGLVEWCKGALAGDFDNILENESEKSTPGLCYYSKWGPVGNYETVGMPMETAMKVFLNPQLIDYTSGSSMRNEMYPFGGSGEYFELDNFKYPWEEPKRKAFLQRIVRYYEGQSDGNVIERSNPFQENALIDHTKGIGDHQDYQTYLKERKEWCKGPKEYIERWQRAYVYGVNVPQTVFANSFEPLYVKA